MYVYMIENLKNNKCYVGITKGEIKNRWNSHKKSAKGNNSSQTIHKAIRKYGVESFSINEIDQATSIDELYKREKFWIKKLDTKNKGYNETDGGEGTLGLVLSEERKNTLRVKANKRWSDPEEKKKHSELMTKWHKYHPISEETREKLKNRDIRVGWQHTEETKKLMKQNSIGKNKGHIKSEETKQLMRENHSNSKERIVIFLDNTEETFISLSEVSRSLNIPKTTLKWIVKHNTQSKKHNIKEIITKQNEI